MKIRKIIIASLLLSLAITISGCGKSIINKQASDQSVLLVIPPIYFNDEEFTEIKTGLETAGKTVKVASIQKGIGKGEKGTSATISYSAGSVEADEFSGVVFIGGNAMEIIGKDDALKNLANKFYQKNKLIGAIDNGRLVLVNAGIIKIANADGAVEAKGNVIISDASMASEFTKKIIEKL